MGNLKNKWNLDRGILQGGLKVEGWRSRGRSKQANNGVAGVIVWLVGQHFW